MEKRLFRVRAHRGDAAEDPLATNIRSTQTFKEKQMSGPDAI